MASNESYLSNEKYGYDFVVAVTQASLNAGLTAYFKRGDFPVSYLCFLADGKGGTRQISLAELKSQTGVDPFEIPDNTDYNDPGITKLTQAKFQIGLKMKIGIPEGIDADKLPPIIEFDNAANNVLFNLLCSEFQIIENAPPGGYVSKGSWTVWAQKGDPLQFVTRVNLVNQDLDKELNTKYFQNHPEKKAALEKRLKALGSNAFSLKQLVFELENAATMDFPRIKGIDPNSDPAAMLQRSFITTYFDAVKERGAPVLAVHAIDGKPDHASLRLSGIEHQVQLFHDGKGNVIQKPSSIQKQLATLNFLCTVNNKPMPPISGFNWNWIEPKDIGEESGVVAINRNTLAEFYKNMLIPIARKSCIKATCGVNAKWYGGTDYSWSVTPGQMPQKMLITNWGSDVVVISYECKAKGYDKEGATVGELNLHTFYDCTVNFSGKTIKIVQHLKIWCSVRWNLTENSGNIVDKAITDTYNLAVSPEGVMSLARSGQPEVEDRSQDPGRSGIVNAFTGVNDLMDEVRNFVRNMVNPNLGHIPTGDLRDFIFPDADVFKYREASFSDHQDLVAKITYREPPPRGWHAGAGQPAREYSEIGLFPEKNIPEGWHICDGQALLNGKKIANGEEGRLPDALHRLHSEKLLKYEQNLIVLPDMKGKEPLPGLTYCMYLGPGP